MRISRRKFGQGLGVVLALAALGPYRTGRAAARTHEVRITGFAFVPAVLSIASGDTVLWRNDDLATHTASGGDWDTGLIGRGQSARRIFAEPGTHDYVCTFHPHMTGRLVVHQDS